MEISTSSECDGGQHESKDKKETKESNEEEIWCGSLSDDVVLEILSRLPPKPFFRFKCVSKTWLALSSPASRLNKLLSRLPTLMGFFWNTGNEIGFSNLLGEGGGGGVAVDGALSALPHHDVYEILGCCNGLLLVRSMDFEPFTTIMYVYNPATQKHTAIEQLPLAKSKWSKKYYSNLCSLDKCSELYSLAFDPGDRLHFHVVCFSHSHDVEGGCTNVFSTFSSHSGSWQQGGTLGCDLELVNHSNGTFLDGRLHRVTIEQEILTVDPINNSYSVTKFGFPGSDNTGACEIGQSHGLLHFMLANQSGRISIWVSENGDLHNWNFKYQLSLDPRFSNVYHSILHIKLHPEKDALLVHLDEHIFSIDLRTGKSNEICILPHPTCRIVWPYMPCFLV